MIWTAIRNGDKIDPGIPYIPNSIQHFGGGSVKGGSSGSLRAAESTEWVGLVVRISQYSDICGRRPHSVPPTHLGTYNSDSSYHIV